jgi:hypothetical protein
VPWAYSLSRRLPAGRYTSLNSSFTLDPKAQPLLISELRATEVLLAELGVAYQAKLADRRPEFGQPAPSLLANLAHETAQVGSPRWREDLAWWAGHLAGCEPAQALPLFAKAAVPEYRGQASTTELTAAESAAVASALQAARLTPATFFLAASVAVLSAWGGAGHAEIVGVPSARRARQSDDRLIGFLLDTLMLRVTAPGELPFASLCGQILTGYLDAAEHSLPPYDEVLRTANLPRLAEGSPLIRLWFNDLTQAACPAEFGGFAAAEYDLPPAAALFDLNVYLRMTTDGRYRLHLVKPAEAMEPADAAALIGQVRAVAVRAAADTSAPVRDIVAIGCPAPAAVTGAASVARRTPARTDALLRRWAQAGGVALVGTDLTLDYPGLDAAVDRVASSLAGTPARGWRFRHDATAYSSRGLSPAGGPAPSPCSSTPPGHSRARTQPWSCPGRGGRSPTAKTVRRGRWAPAGHATCTAPAFRRTPNRACMSGTSCSPREAQEPRWPSPRRARAIMSSTCCATGSPSAAMTGCLSCPGRRMTWRCVTSCYRCGPARPCACRRPRSRWTLPRSQAGLIARG